MSQCTIVVNILLFLCICRIFSNSKFLIYTGIACRSKVCKLRKYLSPKVDHNQSDHDENSDKVEDESVDAPTFEPKDGQQFIEIISDCFRKLPTNEQLQVVMALINIVATKESDIIITISSKIV